jgi:hypothetical protein
VNAEQKHDGRWGLIGPAAMLAVILVVVGWWLLRSEPDAKRVNPPPPIAAAPAPASKPQATPSAEPLEYARDGVPIRPASSAFVYDGGMMHPHGTTPEHERLYRENDLIGSLNAAMDGRDVARMRVLLKQYRDEYPEDANVMQDGYELIANCLEHPSEENRAIAKKYYDERIDSGLRRYIRRHCLEASN